MIDTQRIKKLIEDSGMNKKQFAKVIGRSEQTLHDILRSGKTKIDTLEVIAKALKVAPESLLLTAKILPESDAKSSETNYKELVVQQQKFIDQLGKQIDFLMKENERLNSLILANAPKKQ